MCADPDCHEPVRHEFGFTYANYFVRQRSVLQAMPIEWQRRFVQLMDELEAAIDIEAIPSSFHVHAVDDRGKYASDPYRDYRHGPRVPMREAAPKECR